MCELLRTNRLELSPFVHMFFYTPVRLQQCLSDVTLMYSALMTFFSFIRIIIAPNRGALFAPVLKCYIIISNGSLLFKKLLTLALVVLLITSIDVIHMISSS
jgi:hypothetical protein